MDNYELYQYITDLREKKGLSVTELARQAGISRTTLNNLGACRIDNLSPEVARKLARVLGCPAVVLMRFDEESVATANQPITPRVEITVDGDFRIIPLEGERCRIVAKGFHITQGELEKIVSRFLFHKTDVPDELLEAVKEYAIKLVEGTENRACHLVK